MRKKTPLKKLVKDDSNNDLSHVIASNKKTSRMQQLEEMGYSDPRVVKDKKEKERIAREAEVERYKPTYEDMLKKARSGTGINKNMLALIQRNTPRHNMLFGSIKYPAE